MFDMAKDDDWDKRFWIFTNEFFTGSGANCSGHVPADSPDGRAVIIELSGHPNLDNIVK